MEWIKVILVWTSENRLLGSLIFVIAYSVGFHFFGVFKPVKGEKWSLSCTPCPMTLLWGGDFSPLVTAISSKIQHCNSSIRCMHRFPPVKHRAAIMPSLGQFQQPFVWIFCGLDNGVSFRLSEYVSIHLKTEFSDGRRVAACCYFWVPDWKFPGGSYFWLFYFWFLSLTNPGTKKKLIVYQILKNSENFLSEPYVNTHLPCFF